MINKKKSKVRPKSQKPIVNVQLDEVDRREKKQIKHEYNMFNKISNFSRNKNENISSIIIF